MADTGATSPGTAADDDTIGTKAWTDVDNIKLDDGNYARAATSFDPGWTSHYLKATNFGFTIPGGATINGILVEIEERDGGSTGKITDNVVSLLDENGALTGDNKAKVPAWTAVTTYEDYGGAADDWNAGLSAANINDGDFGVVLSVDEVDDNFATASVDHIQITVYYTAAAAGTNMKINIGDVWKDVESMKINIGDVWKDVAEVKQNIGDAWKVVY